MTTSRELVTRAMEHRNPERVPMWIGFDSDPYNLAVTKDIRSEFESDIMIAGCADPDFVPAGEGYSVMGYKMDTFGETMGEVTEPPLEDWSNFPRWSASLPDYSKSSCYDSAREMRRQHPDKFLIGALNMMMEEIMNLRGFANYMEDFYEEEENLSLLIDRLYEIAHQMVDGYADAGMDAVIAWEDWGLQDSPIMSHAMWTRFFRDKMAAFVRHIHDRGMKYVLHSCGHIGYLLQDFAEMGIDALQLDQQKNMGFDLLGKWKETFCFCCPVDIQHSPVMEPDEMRLHLTEMNANLNHGGGYIYKTYPQPAAIHMTEAQLRRELKFAGELTVQRI